MNSAPVIQNLALDIYDNLPHYLPALQDAARKLLFECNPQLTDEVELFNPQQYQQQYFVNVEFSEPYYHSELTNINAEDCGKLTRIEGTCIRAYPIHPELIRGYFKCRNCGAIKPDQI